MIAGHYRLVERIGRGAMGVVWQAHDERLRRMVAIKQLLPQAGFTAAESADARRRALREARIAARLQHPNAIAVFDVAEHDGDPCLVMEYLPSRSLSAVLADRGSLPIPEVALIGSQVASALAAAHAAGIVHRDVKPGNVLIGDDGTAKITDFGISRAVGDVTVTQTGVFAGTPAYLAPEVARGHDPSTFSDVFALGATLYSAVEGHPPFGVNQNPLALLHVVAAGKVEPPRQAGPLTALLMRLLRAEPTERPTMKEAAEDLASLAIDDDAPWMLRPVPRTPSRDPATATPTVSSAKSAEPEATRTPQATRPVVPTPPRPLRPGYVPTAAVPRGVEWRNTPAARSRSGGNTSWVLVAGAVLVVILGGLAVLGATWWRSNSTDGAAGNSSQQAGPASQPGGGTTTKQPVLVDQPTPPDGAGSIDYSHAGQLVIDYLNGMKNLQTTFAMLTPNAQAAYGGWAGFQDHWSQYSQVSAKGARGVTTNADGSLNVPVELTVTTAGGSNSSHPSLRVTRLGGKLMIDSGPGNAPTP